jgi:AcrR family transcriptional regulator
MKPTAVYHSPLRAAQAAATRERIVCACVTVMRSGGDLTYAGVAAVADVQERTVYRHFPKKEDLEGALWGWIVERLTHADFTAGTEEELIGAMRQSFSGFDADAALITAMLHSPQGLEVRRVQQPGRRAMFERSVDAAVPALPAAISERAAAVLQILYSAASWELLRTFWGMDAATAAETVELGIRCVLDGLRQLPVPEELDHRTTADQPGGHHD